MDNHQCYGFASSRPQRHIIAERPSLGGRRRHWRRHYEWGRSLRLGGREVDGDRLAQQRAISELNDIASKWEGALRGRKLGNKYPGRNGVVRFSERFMGD